MIDGGFDYAIGSVHELTDVHHSNREHFRGMEREEREGYVERYFERVVDLIESGIFDVVAHLDLIERNEGLRGLATEGQYRRVASALEGSPTVPEINGIRIGEGDPVMPRRGFFEMLNERGIGFVRGSDAHGPGSIEARNDRVSGFADECGVELRTIR